MNALSREAGDNIPERYSNPRFDDFVPGARIINNGGYIFEVVSGEPYLDNLPDLIESVAHVQAAIFDRDIRVAREVAKINMESHHHASAIRIRPELVPDKVIGVVTERELFIPTSQGTIPFLYFTMRAIEPEYRRRHLGRDALQVATVLHRGARWAGHRTQSPAAVRSMEESGIFKTGRFFPRESYYDRDGLAQEIMVHLFINVRRNGREVNWHTGVSRADYFEPNRASELDPTHGPTMEIRRWMVDKLKMNFDRGDSLYEIGELK